MALSYLLLYNNIYIIISETGMQPLLVVSSVHKMVVHFWLHARQHMLCVRGKLAPLRFRDE